MKMSILRQHLIIREAVRMILERGDMNERQERGIIDSINKIASPKNPVTVKSSGVSIENVVKASKMSGESSLGKEPYTDVQLTLADGTVLNVSAKGSTAPSLGGGGLLALDMLVPDLIHRFLDAALKALKQQVKPGQFNAPDVYGMIPAADVIKILRGNEEMGGPIDYMYQGPMDVSAKYTGKSIVELNGGFTPIAQYAKTHKLFLRARKRREDQPFDPKSVDGKGMPSLFGKSPTKGDTNRRIVITDKVPSTGITVKF